VVLVVLVVLANDHLIMITAHFPLFFLKIRHFFYRYQLVDPKDPTYNMTIDHILRTSGTKAISPATSESSDEGDVFSPETVSDEMNEYMARWKAKMASSGKGDIPDPITPPVESEASSGSTRSSDAEEIAVPIPEWRWLVTSDVDRLNKRAINEFVATLPAAGNTQAIEDMVNQALTAGMPVDELVIRNAMEWLYSTQYEGSGLLMAPLLNVNGAPKEVEQAMASVRQMIDKMSMRNDLVVPVINGLNQMNMLYISKEDSPESGKTRVIIKVYDAQSKRIEDKFSQVLFRLFDDGKYQGNIDVFHEAVRQDRGQDNSAVHAVLMFEQWLTSHETPEAAFATYQQHIGQQGKQVSDINVITTIRAHVMDLALCNLTKKASEASPE
ncbi:MAG: hypothetical protein ACRC5A_06460, partial [Enterobacteriaceae bacterium]